MSLLSSFSSLYLTMNTKGELADIPTESCIKCADTQYVDIPNVSHQAGRLYLVNDYTDCKKLGNTLIESTSVSHTLYYDISLVDGLTCYPQYIHDGETRVLTQINASTFCGKSMCQSLCTNTKDPHECQILQPYTHLFGDSLRKSPLANSSVYTYAYDDGMGLLITNRTSVRMEFPPVKRETYVMLNFSKCPKAKSGIGIVLHLSLSLLLIAI